MTMPVERPGVYITETLQALPNSGAVPGEAVAAFAAVYNIGPTVPTFVTSFNQFTNLYGSFTQSNGSALHYAVYSYFNNGGAGCLVLRLPNSDASTASLQLQDINNPTDNVITVNAYSPGAWADNVYIQISSAGQAGRFNFVVYSGGTSQANIVEQFIDLSINPSDPRNVATFVNSTISGSKYVTVTVTLPGTYQAGVNDPATINPTALTGGSDGVTAPSIPTLVPQNFNSVQGQIINLNLPGVTNASTINSLISWAAGRGDVMLVIDGPAPNFPETSAQVVSTYTNLVSGGSSFTASSYAALYAPWILINDPASAIPGATRFIPPGGSVLGVWASTDTQVGPWQTPAGVSHGQLNCVDFEVRFTDSDLATLNLNNINALRFVPGYFPAIMGGRTLAQGYPNRYLSVRRELIQLEHDFTFLLQFALFEPNDAALWDQITQVLTNYLTEATQNGVLASTVPSTAFQVICDSSNNTSATAMAGIVNASVAVALAAPAEFILINISQFQNTGTTTTTTATA